MAERLMKRLKHIIRSAWQPLLIFLLLSLSIMAAGWLYSFYHLRDHQKEVFRELESVASLKEKQIDSWLAERMSDAQNIIDNPYIGERVGQLFRQPASENIGLDRLKWMRSLQDLKQYQNVLLLDRRGRIRVQTGQETHRLGPETAALADKVAASGQASFSDFYYCTKCRTVHLDVFAPVVHYHRQRDSVVGVIILRIEPQNLLYPLIQQWPVPSQSAETYLVRRDNGEVLYLTELRFQNGSAAKLRQPLSRKELPEVMAIGGSTGNVTAVDYRGKKVYAYLHNMPSTPWYIIAKADRREAEAIAYTHIWFIVFIVIALIIAAGGIIGSLWNRQQRSYFEKQLEQEQERQALSKHYEYLTKYANDIILLLDQDLKIREANDKAVAVYGYSREKMLTLDIHRLRKTDSRPSVDDQYRKAVDENGLLFETVHQRSDGSAFPAEVSARMIEVEGKKYFQTIARDITERKRDQEVLRSQKQELEAANQELLLANRKLLSSELELRQADEDLRNQLAAVQESRDALERSQASLKQMEEMFEQFLRHSPVYVFFKDENIRPLRLSKNYEQLLGRPLQELLGRTMDELFPSDLARSMVEDDQRVLRDGQVVELDEELNGRHYRTIKFPILQEGRPKMLAGFTLDITERRKAEQSLRELNQRFEYVLGATRTGFDIIDKDYNLIYVDPYWKKAYGEAAGKKCYRYFMNQDVVCPSCGIKTALELKQVVVTQEFLKLENRWVEVHTIPFQDASGAWLAAEFNIDITEHKKSQENMTAALKEKEVLLREVHHRVKNNLQVISSLLNLQSGYITDQRSRELFKECQTRVRSMSLIHERLYQAESLSRLSFSGYARALVEDLFHSYGLDREKVSYSLDIIDRPMKIDTAIPCGLIVNELVSNSLKYAFPSYQQIGRQGLIKIALVGGDDGSLTLSVRDNGVGLPQGFDIEKVGSLGLQLVATLVQQLDGKLEIKNEDGAWFSMIFRAE
jgi:PAS domain S-box-containing protein